MFSDKNWTSHEAKLLLLAGYFVEITIKPQVFKFLFLLPIFNFLLLIFNFLTSVFRVFQFSRFHFHVSAFRVSTFHVSTFSLPLFEFSTFHVSTFRVSTFRVSTFSLPLFEFYTFHVSTFTFPLSRFHFHASNFYASALSITCGNKCLFSNCFRLRNFGITSQ